MVEDFSSSMIFFLLPLDVRYLYEKLNKNDE